MKTLRFFSFLLLFVSISALFASCDEEMTVDVPGPDIEFTFSFSNLRNGGGDFELIAESDTLYGKDVREYLSNSGQDYDSVISSATIKDAIMTLNDGYDFIGVDTMQIRYRIAGTENEMVLATAYLSSSADTLQFSDLKISKVAAFQLISNDVVASLYAKYDKNNLGINNCFQTGVKYTFKAKTVLAVKMTALANGFSL